MVADQTARLQRIVDQILLARRLDTGDLSSPGEVFDASNALDAIVEALPAEQRRRLIVTCPTGIRIHGELDWPRQVIANLVDNALKYSDGAVRVELVAQELSARFTVADDGPGIPAVERERVFEKFHRLDPAQRTGVRGTGLGLYIAHELVGRMGGRIGLLPRERGTTFFVDLPLG